MDLQQLGDGRRIAAAEAALGADHEVLHVLLRGGDAKAPKSEEERLKQQFEGSFLLNKALRALETGGSTGERIQSMFTLAMGRAPTETERQALARYVDKQTDVLRGEGKQGELLTQAAWSGVARVLFNLDEFINRE